MVCCKNKFFLTEDDFAMKYLIILKEGRKRKEVSNIQYTSVHVLVRDLFCVLAFFSVCFYLNYFNNLLYLTTFPAIEGLLIRHWLCSGLHSSPAQWLLQLVRCLTPNVWLDRRRSLGCVSFHFNDNIVRLTWLGEGFSTYVVFCCSTTFLSSRY